MTNVLILHPEARVIIQAAAAASPSVEVCGLLLGDCDEIVEAHLSPNRHPDPAHGFAICDVFHAQLQRAARRRNLRILGCFHSHPSGDGNPSETDLLAAQEDGFVWVICTPDGQIGAWRARIGKGVKTFDMVRLADAHCGGAPGELWSRPPHAPIV